MAYLPWKNLPMDISEVIEVRIIMLCVPGALEDLRFDKN